MLLKRWGGDSFSLYVKSANPPHLGNVRWHYAYKTGKKVWQEDRPFFLTGGINTLYIPKGTLKLYKEAETWKEDFKLVKSVVEFDPIPSEELITEQRTVNVENPGSLSSLLNDYDKYRITNLKLKGELDIQDVEFIREMAGCYAEGGVPKYNGHLWYLDMSEVKFKYPKEYAYLTIYDKDGGKNEAYIEGKLLEEFSCKSTNKLLAYLYNLQSVVLPVDSSKDNIYFLYNCSGLTSVKIPSEVTDIAKGTFSGCSGLTSIDIPSGVTSIGDKAFMDCSKLTSVVIPSCVTSIGNQVFGNCYNLTSLYSYRPDPVAVDSNVFSGIDANKCTLYVPQGSFGNYYVTSGWDYFSKIVEFDPTGIGAVTTKSDAKEVSRYSVDGQKLDTPVKGLNIVKYNDGSIKKVVVE